MDELLSLAKETLGIVSTATAKDNSLKLIIRAGMKDMERAGVKVNIQDYLTRQALMTYVKANFGISNPTDKAKYMESYQLFLAQMSLSDGYKEREEKCKIGHAN